MTKHTVHDVRAIDLPLHERDGGWLVVIESGKTVPYPAARVFTVTAPKGAVRGEHAHKQCSQFFVAAHGAIVAECDDGTEKKTFRLERGNAALFVPPGVWATETYETDGAVLVVLCDRPYEVDDYIRSYEEFLAWRRA